MTIEEKVKLAELLQKLFEEKELHILLSEDRIIKEYDIIKVLVDKKFDDRHPLLISISKEPIIF